LASHFDVTGVDLSPAQIERARRLVPQARFVCDDMSGVTFAEGSLAAVVSFYAIIHLPLDEHPALFRRILGWLQPGGYLLAIVGYEAWTGVEAYHDIEGAEMAWSHADESTNVRWIEEAGFEVLEVRFVPEDDSGHSLVLARRPPIDGLD
jgi:trans-aconitate methyltransferase